MKAQGKDTFSNFFNPFYSILIEFFEFDLAIKKIISFNIQNENFEASHIRINLSSLKLNTKTYTIYLRLPLVNIQ